MRHNRYPVRRGLYAAALGGTLTATAACGQPEVKDPPRTPVKTASVSPSTERTSAGQTTMATVCDGFFTLKMSGDEIWVVGRPVVDSKGQPQDVAVDKSGVYLSPRPNIGGIAVWYTLEGEETTKPNIECQQYAKLYSVTVATPKGAVLVAATNPDGLPQEREYVDSRALYGNSTGIAGLDYGNVDPDGLQEILNQARRG